MTGHPSWAVAALLWCRNHAQITCVVRVVAGNPSVKASAPSISPDMYGIRRNIHTVVITDFCPEMEMEMMGQRGRCCNLFSVCWTKKAYILVFWIWLVLHSDMLPRIWPHETWVLVQKHRLGVIGGLLSDLNALYQQLVALILAPSVVDLQCFCLFIVLAHWRIWFIFLLSRLRGWVVNSKGHSSVYYKVEHHARWCSSWQVLEMPKIWQLDFSVNKKTKVIFERDVIVPNQTFLLYKSFIRQHLTI